MHNKAHGIKPCALLCLCFRILMGSRKGRARGLSGWIRFHAMWRFFTIPWLSLCTQPIHIFLHLPFGLYGMRSLNDCPAAVGGHGCECGECLGVFCQRHAKAHGKFVEIHLFHRMVTTFPSPTGSGVFFFIMFGNPALYTLCCPSESLRRKLGGLFSTTPSAAYERAATVNDEVRTFPWPRKTRLWKHCEINVKWRRSIFKNFQANGRKNGFGWGKFSPQQVFLQKHLTFRQNTTILYRHVCICA